MTSGCAVICTSGCVVANSRDAVVCSSGLSSVCTSGVVVARTSGCVAASGGDVAGCVAASQTPRSRSCFRLVVLLRNPVLVVIVLLLLELKWQRQRRARCGGDVAPRLAATVWLELVKPNDGQDQCIVPPLAQLWEGIPSVVDWVDCPAGSVGPGSPAIAMLGPGECAEEVNSVGRPQRAARHSKDRHTRSPTLKAGNRKG